MGNGFVFLTGVNSTDFIFTVGVSFTLDLNFDVQIDFLFGVESTLVVVVNVISISEKVDKQIKGKHFIENLRVNKILIFKIVLI